MLCGAVRSELVLGCVLFSNVLTLDVQRTRENWIPRIAVVEDYHLVSASRFAQSGGRTRVHEPVINFESVSASVFSCQEEAEQPGVVWIGDIVECHSGLNRLTLWRLYRICTTRVLGANKDFPSVVDTQVVASRPRVTWDEAQGAHVPWVS